MDPLTKLKIMQAPLILSTPIDHDISMPAFKFKRGIPKPCRDSRNDPKIGRNEPCPCGSGKKYKKCCVK